MRAIQNWTARLLILACSCGAASAATNLVTVVAWGDNSSGQTAAPLGPTNLASIAAGYFRNLAVTVGGTAIAWGSPIAGDTTVVPSLKTIVATAVGGQHSLALKTNGTVVAWGDNSLGQTTVPAGLNSVVAIAAGTNHSLALSNHNVVAWGRYYNGVTNVLVTVPPGLTNIIAIACGDSHSLALRSNGLVVAWGNNSAGQANVPVGLTNVVAIAAGTAHGLALRSSGVVVAWGSNSDGQTNVPPALTNVIAIAAGGSHSLALRSDGTVVAWGDNVSGQTDVPTWLTNVTALSAGCSHSVVLTLDPRPIITLDGVVAGSGSVTRTNTTVVAMTSTFDGADIYYTLDGSAPDFLDIPYAGAFPLTNSHLIRAIAYDHTYTNAAMAAPVMVNILPVFPLTVTTAGGGSFSIAPPPLSGTTNLYLENTEVILTATTNSGWWFIGWAGDSTATTTSTPVVMTKAQTVQAVFGTPLSVFNAGHGSVEPANGLYPYGTNLLLTARPDTNYAFYGWADNATGFANPLSLTITSPAPAITALFGMLNSNQVALTVVSNGAGTVMVSPQRTNYTKGDAVTLVAVPAANHVFAYWTNDVSGNLNPLALTLTTNVFITANFTPGTNAHPTITLAPPLNRTLDAGADTTLAADVTGDGPLLCQWRINGSPIPGASTPTLALTNLTSPDAGLYDLVVAGPGGSVTSPPVAIALFGLEMVPSDTDPLPLLILDHAPGAPYQIQYSSNLPPQGWRTLVSVTNLDTRFYYVDTNTPRRFYRALRP